MNKGYVTSKTESLIRTQTPVFYAFFQNYEIRYKQKIIEFRQSGRDSVSLKKIKSIETKI